MAAFCYIPKMEHRWNVSIPEATQIQKSLRDDIRLTPLTRQPRTVAGADISFERFSDLFHAAIVVFSYPELDVIERATATLRVRFPYVPGYLSFREVPALVKAYDKLKIKPDVIMLDGQGIAHPRRLGVASHVGLALDTPTIGCAKSRLYGVGKDPASRKGSVSRIRDPKDGDVIGAYVRTKDSVKPVIISPGHRITLEESIDIALTCVRSHRIPEPTRLAHNLANEARKKCAARR